MTEQEILAIAKKVVELQAENSQSKQVAVNSIAEVTKKYHKQIWERFGSTNTIESAVRAVGCYMSGGRTLNSLSIEQYYNCLDVMEELFNRIVDNNKKGCEQNA